MNEKKMTNALPDGSEERKGYPLYRGLFRYFPRALAAVAHHSFVNNEKHNPGEPMHWAREKSTDHPDCILRHVLEGDWVSVAWRALAQLELSLEANAGIASTTEAKIQAKLDAAFDVFRNRQEDIDNGNVIIGLDPGAPEGDQAVVFNNVPVADPDNLTLAEQTRCGLAQPTFQVYLCGPITGQEVDYTWRAAAAAYLQAHGIHTLDPLRGKHKDQISQMGLGYRGQLAAPEIADRDQMDIDTADVLLAHFPYTPPRQSIGSLMEMGMAVKGGKPVILCTTEQVFNDHLFCRNFCTLEPDFQAALDRIVALAQVKRR